MKRIFFLLLVLCLFVSVPVFASDITVYDAGLYSDVDLPDFPDSLPSEDYPYYLIYYDTYGFGYDVWSICFFATVDGLKITYNSNSSFNLTSDGSTVSKYPISRYRLDNNSWVWSTDDLIDSYNVHYLRGTALNFSNFSLVAGEDTLLANPMMGGVPRILLSHLPRLP